MKQFKTDKKLKLYRDQLYSGKLKNLHGNYSQQNFTASPTQKRKILSLPQVLKEYHTQYGKFYITTPRKPESSQGNIDNPTEKVVGNLIQNFDGLFKFYDESFYNTCFEPKNIEEEGKHLLGTKKNSKADFVKRLGKIKANDEDKELEEQYKFDEILHSNPEVVGPQQEENYDNQFDIIEEKETGKKNDEQVSDIIYLMRDTAKTSDFENSAITIQRGWRKKMRKKLKKSHSDRIFVGMDINRENVLFLYIDQIAQGTNLDQIDITSLFVIIFSIFQQKYYPATFTIEELIKWNGNPLKSIAKNTITNILPSIVAKIVEKMQDKLGCVKAIIAESKDVPHSAIEEKQTVTKQNIDEHIEGQGNVPSSHQSGKLLSETKEKPDQEKKVNVELEKSNGSMQQIDYEDI